MKLASFLTVSVALHALALAYPVVFYKPATAPLIPVTILSRGDDAGVDRGNGRKGNKGISTDRSESQPESKGNGRPQTGAAQSAAQSVQVATIDSPSANESTLNIGLSPMFGGVATDTTLSPGTGLHGQRSGRGQFVEGTGAGDGIGSQGNNFSQANYRTTPQPAYPESARREGREGRVLLRVLVDEEGKSKSIEVSRSSGSEALDQAATRAIKQWRFSPARIGDKPVASWVRVPIEFRLTDLRN
jgi:TonB family protein